jgi:disulfide bond formation protein DsbB
VEVEAVQLFTSLLAVLAVVGALGLVMLRLVALRSPAAHRLGTALAPAQLPLAWLVALGATLGSLYFSEIANYEPCLYCWYQRIAMYPLSVLLLVALIRRDRNIAWYAVPIAAMGALLSLRHRYLELNPTFGPGGCSADVPCSAVWFERLGFVTLSVMALFGFVSIIVLLTVRFRSDDSSSLS